MRLFVSYARVDKPYCIQIVDILDVHETWYDQRLYAGQDWWKEILRRLDWCEGFIYLLSPNSVNSDYCRQEYELAKSLDRPIFPVLIRKNTPIPANLSDLQFVDLTDGLNSRSVKMLLNSIYVAERQRKSRRSVAAISPDETKPPLGNQAGIIRGAMSAMENGQYDQAVFLLRQAKSSGFQSRYLKLEVLLKEAEAALEREMYLAEAAAEYEQILAVVRHKPTEAMGLAAFQAFRQDYPDYDPENLARYTSAMPKLLLPSTRRMSTPANGFVYPLPLMEWCEIPAGRVEVAYKNGDNAIHKKEAEVACFNIAKYPVTNAQYQIFLNDKTGYANSSWWQFSPEAYTWRLKHPTPPPSRFKGDERPREMISWYDALAFCNWLSAHLGARITLPTAAQWQHALQGNNPERIYPWGETFVPGVCN
ncbi:MAG: SUMF1/EgtB/PvdO family nonheme iron enzyme, partial [Anaerolineae bacterium]|nr:SUMF1/EgtB/PvdO family nonheme iron enzyme [Anaerolineae bacterium]